MVRGQNAGRFDAYELLWQFRARGIHTALDTCGACVWAQMQPLLPYTDLVLFDLKHMDSAQHRRMTGLGNERILENFRNIQALGGVRGGDREQHAERVTND